MNKGMRDIAARVLEGQVDGQVPDSPGP